MLGAVGDTSAGRPLPVAAMTELDGVVALYSATTDQVLVLSETASDIFRLLDGVRTQRQVVEAVAARYAMAPEEVEADVVAALGSFRDAGLLSPPGA